MADPLMESRTPIDWDGYVKATKSNRDGVYNLYLAPGPNTQKKKEYAAWQDRQRSEARRLLSSWEGWLQGYVLSPSNTEVAALNVACNLVYLYEEVDNRSAAATWLNLCKSSHKGMPEMPGFLRSFSQKLESIVEDSKKNQELTTISIDVECVTTGKSSDLCAHLGAARVHVSPSGDVGDGERQPFWQVVDFKGGRGRTTLTLSEGEWQLSLKPLKGDALSPWRVDPPIKSLKLPVETQPATSVAQVWKLTYEPPPPPPSPPPPPLPPPATPAAPSPDNGDKPSEAPTPPLGDKDPPQPEAKNDSPPLNTTAVDVATATAEIGGGMAGWLATTQGDVPRPLLPWGTQDERTAFYRERIERGGSFAGQLGWSRLAWAGVGYGSTKLAWRLLSGKDTDTTEGVRDTAAWAPVIGAASWAMTGLTLGLAMDSYVAAAEVDTRERAQLTLAAASLSGMLSGVGAATVESSLQEMRKTMPRSELIGYRVQHGLAEVGVAAGLYAFSVGNHTLGQQRLHAVTLAEASDPIRNALSLRNTGAGLLGLGLGLQASSWLDIWLAETADCHHARWLVPTAVALLTTATAVMAASQADQQLSTPLEASVPAADRWAGPSATLAMAAGLSSGLAVGQGWRQLFNCRKN